MKPIIADVEAFTLIDATGELRKCSRTDNAELFKLAIGGYGLFGIIATVTLRLVRRQKVERVVEIIEIDKLMAAFDNRVAAGFLYGDWQYSIDPASADFLSRGVFACYRPVDPATPMSETPKELTVADWRNLIYLAHTDKKKAWEVYSGRYLATSGQIYWSDRMQQSVYIDDYHRELDPELSAGKPATEMIAEIYVPRAALATFLAEVRADFTANAVDLIYGTVRLVERDDESFLAWATQPWACVIFNLHGLTPPAANGNNVALRTLPQLLAGLLCGALGGALVAVVLLMIIDMPELTPLYVATYASFVPPLLLLVFLTTESIYIGLVCYRTQDEDREWWARSGGWLLLAGLGWIILNLVSFFGSGTLTYLFDEHEKILAALGISGGASGVVAALLGKSAITSALQKDKNGDGITGQLSKLVLPMLALIFILALFIALAAGVNWVVLRAVDAAGLVEDRARWHGLCGDQNWCKAVADTQAIGLSGAFFALVVVAVFCLVLSRFININRFSLHATYRSRLIRAYLGASRRERKPDAFTGFDPKDNIRFRTILEGDQKREPTGRFLHLVCIALNLVGGERLDWQQRKASSFTVSALHSGARILGYRRSSEYGAEKGISLGTAMAISGAAASPNMIGGHIFYR